MRSLVWLAAVLALWVALWALPGLPWGSGAIVSPVADPTPPPTCTPTPTATATPTAAPTGWLGPLIVRGQVVDQRSLAPIASARVSGSVSSIRGGGGALPVATTEPDGSYQLPAGFPIYDTDTFHIQAAAAGYGTATASAPALSIYSGNAVDLALEPLLGVYLPLLLQD